MSNTENTFYSNLSQSDIKWFNDNAKSVYLIMNQVLIKNGDHHDNFYIVNEGLLSLKTTKISQFTVIELSPGEVIGDVFLFGSKQSSSDVVALLNSNILSIPIPLLKEKLYSDKLFELNFYKSLAMVINKRLNSGYDLLNRTHLNINSLEEVNEIWDKVVKYTNLMKKLLQDANNEYLKKGCISKQTSDLVKNKFVFFTKYFNRIMFNNNQLPDNLKEEIGRRISFELLPYLLLTYTAERGFAKPRGYAGDYLMIYQIYENKATGKGALGELFDRCWLNASVCKAVRNRRFILKDQIMHTIKSNQGVTNIASMACGPAQEIFDCYEVLENPAILKSTLVDIDNDAVSFVENKISQYKINDHIRIFSKNLVFLAKGKDKLDILEQDLVYSIGLMDYFSDKAVIAFLDYFYKLLKINGRAIIGNFHPRNDSRAIMEYIIDWRLIHRTEEQMIELFSKSLFKNNPVEFVYEEQRINLFAICTKN